MFNEILTVTIAIVVMVLLIAGIVSIVKDKHRGSAGDSVFHNMQTKDKQNAMEMVIEQKASKKMHEQERGKEKDTG